MASDELRKRARAFWLEVATCRDCPVPEDLAEFAESERKLAARECAEIADSISANERSNQSFVLGAHAVARNIRERFGIDRTSS